MAFRDEQFAYPLECLPQRHERFVLRRSLVHEFPPVVCGNFTGDQCRSGVKAAPVEGLAA